MFQALASKKRRLISIATLAGVLALMASLVPASLSTASTAKHIGGSVTLWAEWTSAEQQDFEAVLTPFEASTGVNVIYSGKGSNMDTAIDAAVAGGAPPAVALVPDPGTLLALAKKGAIKPLAPVLGSEVSDYGSAWNKLATYKNKLYGVWFKGANKNTIWYNPAEFAMAGLKSGTQDMAAAAHLRGHAEESGRHALLALHQHRLAGC